MITIAIYYVLVVTVSIGYHRLLSHSAFECHPFWRWFFVGIGVLAWMGSPVRWARFHDDHHRYADRDGDPHSPVLSGWRCMLLKGYWPKDSQVKRMRSLMKVPAYRFYHNHSVPIAIGTGLLLFVVLPFELFIDAYVLPVALFHLLAYRIGFVFLLHKKGYRNFETPGHDVNSVLAFPLLLGDAWHNNHHKYPLRPSTTVKPWEIDPAGWVVKLVSRTHQHNG